MAAVPNLSEKTANPPAGQWAEFGLSPFQGLRIGRTRFRWFHHRLISAGVFGTKTHPPTCVDINCFIPRRRRRPNVSGFILSVQSYLAARSETFGEFLWLCLTSTLSFLGGRRLRPRHKKDKVE